LTRKFIIAILVLISHPIFSFAQLHWEKEDSRFTPLPASMHVFKTTSALDSAPFIAYYVSVLLKDKNLLFNAQVSNGNPYTPDQYYQSEKEPLLIVNAGFFSLETGEVLSAVVRNGKIVAHNVMSLKGTGVDSMLYYYPTRSAIGIDRKRHADVAWIFTDSLRRRPYAFEKAPVIAKGSNPNPLIFDLKEIEWQWWEMRTAIGGGPALIHDGQTWITNKEEQMFVGEENEKQPRTAMGYTRDGRLIILVIQGRYPGVAEGATLTQEAQILKDLGCYEALNLGGGGNSCMLVNGKQTILPSDKTGQRPVPAVFIVKRSTK
jgi:hypothetical protein